MKKYLSLILAFSIFICSLSLVSCTDDTSGGNVTYVFGDGRSDKTEPVTDIAAIGEYVPERRGYIFIGWCTDPELESFYNPACYKSGDIVLYARWMRDITSVANEIAEDALTFNVKVKRESYDIESLYPVETSVGSGVIYKKTGTQYYVITNNHIIETDFSYNYYTVYDAYGNEYRATVVARDKSYDLAVLSISRRSDVTLSQVKIDERDPNRDEQIVSLGSPGGIYNSVTYGKITDYRIFEAPESEGAESEKNEIEFPIIWHTAFSKQGSSGGALLSADLKLIGINYAVASGKDGVFMYTFAIPIKKVVEFLNKYEIA